MSSKESSPPPTASATITGKGSVTATTTTAQPPAPAELKYMTSNNALGLSPTRVREGGSASATAGNRMSQHLRTIDPRYAGSKSPHSIPSSPTSIHSSSSAIFERDIEPIIPPSPPSTHYHHHPPNPHRIPRAKTTEALEQSVPSVLDSAAAILGGLEDVEVVSPVPLASSPSVMGLGIDAAMGRSSGFTSPIGSFRSRSPSPMGSRVASQTLGGGVDLLLGVPVPSAPGSSYQQPSSMLGLQLGSASSSPPRHVPQQLSQAQTTTTIAPSATISNIDTAVSGAATPAIVTPTTEQQVSPTATSLSASPSPKDRVTRLPTPGLSPLPPSPSTLATSNLTSPLPPAGAGMTSPVSLAPTTSYPPSPVHGPKKRLSFMSYSDLISSTPSSTQPLSSLTTCATTTAEPPHIPSVSGLNIVNAIHAHQLSQPSSSSPLYQQTQAPFMPGSNVTSAAPSIRGFNSPLGPTGGLTHAGKRESIAILDNVGGEWERQGLGKGLEERLEALVFPPASASVTGSPSVAQVPIPVQQTVVGSNA